MMTFCDASKNFSAAVTYIITVVKDTDTTKVQMFTSISKLWPETDHLNNISTIPAKETWAACLGSQLHLKTIEMTKEQNIKITGNHIFVDAISIIIQLSSHPA